MPTTLNAPSPVCKRIRAFFMQKTEKGNFLYENTPPDYPIHRQSIAFYRKYGWIYDTGKTTDDAV